MTQETNKEKWVADLHHSHIQFKVRHLGISTVRGHFANFEGHLMSSKEGFEDAEIDFSIEVDGLKTGNASRDHHLLSDEFFHVNEFPEITFRSKSFKPVGKDGFKLEGVLTMKGEAKQVSLDVEYGGIAQDPLGTTRAGFELSGKIKRQDFGLKWEGYTEAGDVLVGDDVEFDISLEFTREEDL